MKNQNYLLVLAVGAIAYFAYMEVQKKKKQGESGDGSGGGDTTDANKITLPSGSTWSSLAKSNSEILQKVKALQSGLNIVLTQMGKKILVEDGLLGALTQKAIFDVFGDHMGSLKVGDMMTLNWYLKQLADKKALKKEDVRFLSNQWFINLWK
jgi:hypothetical protein